MPRLWWPRTEKIAMSAQPKAPNGVTTIVVSFPLLDYEKMKISKDTRTIKRGDYYVSVKGEKFDGHDFLNEAMAKGAAGIIEESDLYELAKKKLRELKPAVVAVTGSVGKTTTKEAIGTVLSEKYKTLTSAGNLNTLLGLSIEVINKLTSKHEIFVCEMGMDRPNEIKETCEVVKPSISVVTSINEAHLEKLGTLEAIIKTKGEILEALDVNGYGVLNLDDPNSVPLRKIGNCKKVYFSTREKTDFWASAIRTDSIETRFAFNCSYGDLRCEGIEVSTPLLGSYCVYTCLAAAAAAVVAGCSLIEVKNGLAKLKLPKGRLNILKGINGSTLIDDTYNASPVSGAAALDVLKIVECKRKIVVMGDMLELGSYENVAHEKVGLAIADADVDLFVAVGEKMQLAADSYAHKCKVSGKKPRLMKYDSVDEALLKIVADIALKEGDAMLIKGSQGMRLEKITKLFLADQSKASDLLVRQDSSWV